MAQARLKGSGIISYDNSDFDSATQVNYIDKNKTAADAEGEPIKGSFEFRGTAAVESCSSNKAPIGTAIGAAMLASISVVDASAVMVTSAKCTEVCNLPCSSP